METTDPPQQTTDFERYQQVEQDIEGWFQPGAVATWDALLTAQAALKVHGNLFEIGVWKGKSACLLALHTRFGEENLMLVDKYAGSSELEANLLRVGVEDVESIQFLRADSRSLHTHPILAEGYRTFRWFHIDGEHTAGGVRNDLQIADALVSTEGIVCIDDFFNPLYPQVTEGVLRYVRDHPDSFTMFLCGVNKAYLARPHFVHKYLEYCASDLGEDLASRGTDLTIGKTTYPAEMNCFGLTPRFQNRTYRGMDDSPDKIRI